MKPPRLSIIMPALNEASRIACSLTALTPMLTRGAELIVVDGGSNDGTPARALAAGACLVSTKRGGRALQMNAGAARANGEVLLFLHADTLLPPEADRLIDQALAAHAKGRPIAWGRFDVRISGQPFMLVVIAAMMNLRSRLTGVATGDQAMFMTRRAFEALHGFKEQPLMEDIDMSNRLLTLSRPACISQKVTTSGRRWETRGVWRTVLLMWRLRFAYWQGVAPEELARLYR